MSERYSFSRVSTLDQCPKKYQYRYVERAKESFEGIEGFVGSVVHEVMQWLVQDWLLAKKALPSPDALRAKVAEVWDRRYDADRIRVVKPNDSVTAQIARAQRLVANGHQLLARDPRCHVACEVEVRYSLDDDTEFFGYVDRLSKANTDLLYVVDYKTSNHVPAKLDGKDRDQLHIYGAALMQQPEYAEVPAVILEAQYLSAPAVRRATMRREEIDVVEQWMRAGVSDCRGETEFPAAPSTLCRWCGYNDQCEEAQT